MISLSHQFVDRWRINIDGGARARILRWRVAPWLIAQRLGIHCWVKVPLFFGERMYVYVGEPISSALIAFGYSEVALTALMLHFLRPGMHFVDVGAHLGYEALLGASLVGPTGRVVTFEPNPEIFPRLVRNLGHLPQARAIQSAVGDYIGEIEFDQLPILGSAFAGTNIDRSGGKKIRVPVTTLARILSADNRPVDFIKCDVEGSELSVLRGCREILAQDQPLLVLEADMPSEDPERTRAKELADYLRPFGYTAIDFDFNGELQFKEIGHLTPGHANVAYIPSRFAGIWKSSPEHERPGS